VIYQPHTPNSEHTQRTPRRQAVRRAHTDFNQDRQGLEHHWQERPTHAPVLKRLSRAIKHGFSYVLDAAQSLAAKMLKIPRTAAFGGLALAAAVVVLPLSASMLANPEVRTVKLSLALPPISQTMSREAATSVPNLGSDLYVAGVNDDQWQVETVRRNETVGDIFGRLNIGQGDVHRIVNFSAQTEELARVFPGEQIAFRMQDGKLTGLQFDGDEAHRVLLTVDGEEIAQRLIERHMEHRVSYASASIEHSLFGSAMDADMSDALIVRLAGIFNYDIDFAQDLQPGDSFALVYEQIYRDGEKLRDGEIIAATFINQGKRYEVYRFEDDAGRPDYLSADGRSRKKAFIRTPVEFTRITSKFSPNRLHPIMGRMMRHMGVDYAAPTGTPIMATGNAVVEFIGVQNGYGNVIYLKHPGGIETIYGHQSRFAKGLHLGDRVSQNEIIGYVGMTGLATGPHLHYEFRIGGTHKDPLSVDLPVSDPLSGPEMARFKASTAPLLAQLSQMQQALAMNRGERVER
jgi:murein DD-endopeptidase MepM/ murein hydrolase activator NlpD